MFIFHRKCSCGRVSSVQSSNNCRKTNYFECTFGNILNNRWAMFAFIIMYKTNNESMMKLLGIVVLSNKNPSVHFASLSKSNANTRLNVHCRSHQAVH